MIFCYPTSQFISQHIYLHETPLVCMSNKAYDRITTWWLDWMQLKSFCYVFGLSFLHLRGKYQNPFEREYINL